MLLYKLSALKTCSIPVAEQNFRTTALRNVGHSETRTRN